MVRSLLVLAGLAVATWVLDRLGLIHVPWWTVLTLVVPHFSMQWATQWWARRRAVRRGVVEGALRRAASPGAASPPGWRQGSLSAGPGSLRFVPYGPGGLRFPRRDPVELGVTRLSDTGRRTGWRTVGKLRPDLHVCTLDGSAGRFELACEGRDVSRLQAGLGMLES